MTNAFAFHTPTLELQQRFGPASEYQASIVEFFHERLEFYLRDALGFAYDVAKAVLAASSDDVVDCIVRARAVAEVRGSDDFASISIAFKRMKNIVRQARQTGKEPATGIEDALLSDPAERDLAELAPKVAMQARRLGQEKRYREALTEIAQLRPAIDKFFDKVMIMVDDEHIRGNRLALLSFILEEFSTIADFSEIVTEKTSS